MAGRLPDFLIVGAPKCGTTSLASWLREHPQAFVPEAKELHFFNREEHWRRGLDWYAEQFAGAGDARVAGEATPAYLFGAPTVERIAATLPGVKAIVCLRDPVDRAYSHWHHWYHRLVQEWRPFEEAVADELAGREHEREQPGFGGFDAAMGYYLAHGRYLEQLERLTALLGRDRIEVVLLDDLEARPAETFAHVCRYLGIDDSIVPEGVGSARNVATEFHPVWLWRLLVRHKERLPAPVATWLAMHVFRREAAERHEMDASLRARLREHFAEDNARLGAWLGRDLSAWGYPTAAGTGIDSSVRAASDPRRTL